MMFQTLTFIIFLAVASDVALNYFDVPIPGTIGGLLILSSMFAIRGSPTESAGRLFDSVIPFAPLLFVPAAVGIVANVELIRSEWVAILGAITLSTAVTIIVTGHVAQRFLRWFDSQDH